MRTTVIIIFLICLCGQLFGQNNKLRADAGVFSGAVIPTGLHKYRKGLSDQPWQFAGRGSFANLECSSGFGNGWKGGLTFTFGSEKLYGREISDYFRSRLDTNNFYVTPTENSDGYYAINVFMAHMANDIEVGRLLISPKLAIGITAFKLSFHSEYHMKEKGTNYMKETYFSGSENPGLDFTVSPSLSIGYLIPFREDRIALCATTSFIAQRGTIAIDSYTRDIHDNVDFNTVWSRGLVSYLTVGIGLIYYLMPDQVVSNNSDRTRERRSKKYEAEEER